MKAKRKGRRGNYSVALGLIIVIAFVGIWLLIRNTPNGVATPTPIPPHGTFTPSPVAMFDPNTSTPTQATSILHSTSTGTAIAVPSRKPLRVESLCSNDLNTRSNWRVSNDNPYSVRFVWNLTMTSTYASAPATVPAAQNGTPGTLDIRTVSDKNGLMLMQILVDGQIEAFSPYLRKICATLTPTPNNF